MKRRIDEFLWHCGPHPCACPGSDGKPKAWRYAVVARDFAYALTICASSGQLSLHRTFAVGYDDQTRPRCDLLGECSVVKDPCMRVVLSTAGPQLDEGLMFWSRHAVPGKREQPERFWRALERAGRAAAKAAKASRATVAHCPRCQGTGVVTVKPKKEGVA